MPEVPLLLGGEIEEQARHAARMEERFVWIVASTILVDVIWFNGSPSVTLPIVVLILQLVALTVIGRRMGVDDFVRLVERILYGFGQKGGGN